MKIGFIIISSRPRAGNKNKSCIFKIHVIQYIGNKKGKGGESFAEYQIFYFKC